MRYLTIDNLGGKMKNFFVGLMAGFLILCLCGFSQATSFDQDVTNNAIFGTGNGNGYWTVDIQGNLELGLRAKERWHGVYNSNSDGTYNHSTGISSGTAAIWNYEFSINVDVNGTGSYTLADYSYFLSIDTDPTQGINWITFSPFAAWDDNSFGDNTTAQSAGVEYDDFGLQTTALSDHSLAQNSQNIGWAGIPGFDPTADGTYDFSLYVTSATGGNILAQTDITVIVGQGGAPVPEPATMLLFGLGLLGVAGVNRKKK